MAAMVNMTSLLNGKDSRWLQLEVCREFQRNKCSRQDTECKFAHPPANVEVQNGKVTACYDSIKGRCNRDKPPCKYFHPPQHLKDQLLINGRNHLALKNALMQQMGIAPGQPVIPGQVPAVATNPYLTGIPANTYSPYFAPGHLVPALLGPDPSAVASQLGPVVPQAVQVAQQKIPRSDRLEAYSGMVPIKRPAAEKSGIPVYPGATTYQQLMQLQQPFVPVSSSKKIPINASYVIYTDESGQLLDTLPVCQDFNRSMCSRLNCRFVHLTEDDKVEVCDQRVAVCRDHANGQCRRKQCKYYHIPIVLPPANIMAALINGNHNNSTIISSNNNSSINNNNNNSNITNLNTQHNQLQTTQQQQQQQQHDFEQHILQQQQKVATTCGVMPAVATTIATTNYNNNLIIIEPHHQQSPQQQQQHPHHHQQQQQQQQHFYTPATISYTTQHHPQQATTLATPKVLTSQSSQLFHATPTTHITTVPHIFHTSPHQQQQQQQQQFQQLQYTTANTTAYQGSHPHQQMPQHTIQHQTHHHHPHQHHQTHHHITSPYSPSAASTSSSASSSCSKACSPTLSTTTTHSTTSTATIPTPMAANYLPLAAAAAPLPPSNTTNYLKAPPPPPPNAATAMTLAIATQAPLVLGCSTLSNSSYSTNCIPILTTPPDVSALAGATTLSHHHHHHQTGHATAFIYPATAQPQH
ncbi:basic-leucine zipper transcription factor A isoform X12 [Stomoxys calcitrans]|uniref:basic-leucine zipper transcription factor A isoform X12 n=1 Tax=Stomoxys calcitrans TaxID=35570 RepID=UPI0027E3995E|nr:basic-leucine zipper transcription factor A isoform X12 [Stomoxys calcitrans]